MGRRPAAGYDRLNVRGTNDLGGAHLEVRLGFAPQEGDSFRILNNDGTDPVGGTFAGLTNGARFTVNGLPFQISYTGGTGNDVVLTVTNTVLRLASAVAVQRERQRYHRAQRMQHARHHADQPCQARRPVSPPRLPPRPGVFVSQPFSTYPDLKGGDAGVTRRRSRSQPRRHSPVVRTSNCSSPSPPRPTALSAFQCYCPPGLRKIRSSSTARPLRPIPTWTPCNPCLTSAISPGADQGRRLLPHHPSQRAGSRLDAGGPGRHRGRTLNRQRRHR